MYTNLALAAALASAASAQVYQGFNYGSTYTNGQAKQSSDFANEFTAAQNLVGHQGFTSARLYTMIQEGTAGNSNTPISAIQAAIDTKTTLLLGLWATGGQGAFNNELSALDSACSQYGSGFTNLIAGISVGSEDLYRISPTGIAYGSDPGEGPDAIVSYIGQVRQILTKYGVKAPVGHVDTWTAWVNGSNSAVVDSSDFLGVDMYPYFQTNDSNGIDNAANLFYQAYGNTTAAAKGKPVWITETGQPVSGHTSGANVPSTQNAKIYWDQVACKVLGQVSTWWYTLQDASPETPDPSFGLVGSSPVGAQLPTQPLYDLTCPGQNSPTTSGVVPPATGLPSGVGSPSATPTGNGYPSGPGSTGGQGSSNGGSAPGSSAPGTSNSGSQGSTGGQTGSSAPGTSNGQSGAPNAYSPSNAGSANGSPGSPYNAPGSSAPGASNGGYGAAPYGGNGTGAPGSPSSSSPGSPAAPGAPGASSTPGAYPGSPSGSAPPAKYTGAASANRPAVAVIAAALGLAALLA